MNTFEAIHIEYLRPSRTIETILVENIETEKILFVYNYEGTSFRVFKSLSDLIKFFSDKSEADFCFSTENELDNFLAEIELLN